MRQLVISIYPRKNTNDISLLITSSDTANTNIYALSRIKLMYSILTSNVLSQLVLTCNQPMTKNNVIRSGQPVEITDNGETVFQGTVIQVLDSGALNNRIVTLILAPSIFQLTLLPMIFDSTQAQQVSNLTGVNTTFILAGGVAQQINLSNLLSYMITNTDYNNIFNKTIQVSNEVSQNIYLMASAGQKRDEVLRSSLDFQNVVIYQNEVGNINIRQLSSQISAPFNLDASNYNVDINNLYEDTPTVYWLSFNYQDSAAIVPTVVSNYSILSANLSVAAQINALSYKANPTYYPRIKQLSDNGWFVGEIGQTQINDNIVAEPAVASLLNQLSNNVDQYLISSNNSANVPSIYGAYQNLLTAKQIAQELKDYAKIEATISLDDNKLSKSINLNAVLGTIMKVQNCDLDTCLIATCSRDYSANGAFLSFTGVPLGSITGFWLN